MENYSYNYIESKKNSERFKWRLYAMIGQSLIAAAIKKRNEAEKLESLQTTMKQSSIST